MTDTSDEEKLAIRRQLAGGKDVPMLPKHVQLPSGSWSPYIFSPSGSPFPYYGPGGMVSGLMGVDRTGQLLLSIGFMVDVGGGAKSGTMIAFDLDGIAALRRLLDFAEEQIRHPEVAAQGNA